MRISFVLILSLAACLFASPVSAGSATGAESPSGNGGRLSSKGISELNKLEFNIIDAGKDGFLSQEELKARGLVVFNAIDADKDGMLSKADLRSVPSPLLLKLNSCGYAMGESSQDKVFTCLDRNGDGKVDKAEFQVAFIAVFNILDTDGDGKVSLSEYLVLHIARKEASAAKAK